MFRWETGCPWNLATGWWRREERVCELTPVSILEAPLPDNDFTMMSLQNSAKYFILISPSIEHWTERVFCLLAFAFYLCLFTVSACWNNDEMYYCNDTRNILYFCAELCLLSLCVAGTKDPKHPSCRMSPLCTMRLEPILTLDPVTHGDVAQLNDVICNLSKNISFQIILSEIHTCAHVLFFQIACYRCVTSQLTRGWDTMMEQSLSHMLR